MNKNITAILICALYIIGPLGAIYFAFSQTSENEKVGISVNIDPSKYLDMADDLVTIQKNILKSQHYTDVPNIPLRGTLLERFIKKDTEQRTIIYHRDALKNYIENSLSRPDLARIYIKDTRYIASQKDRLVKEIIESNIEKTHSIKLQSEKIRNISDNYSSEREQKRQYKRAFEELDALLARICEKTDCSSHDLDLDGLPFPMGGPEDQKPF